MKNISVCSFLTLLFCMILNPLAHAETNIDPLKIAPAEIEIINKLSAFLHGNIDKNGLQYLKEQMNSTIMPIKLLALTILYKNDPDDYYEDFFKAYAIHDYAERSRGEYKIIDKQEIIDVTEQLEKQNEGIKDKSVFALLAFCLFKGFQDKNQWFESDGEEISAARYFRSFFLARVFGGSGVDVLEIVNEIDRTVEQQDLPKPSDKH